jgi:hypothetical protein
MEKARKTFDYFLKDFKPNLNYKDSWIPYNDSGTKMLERYNVELPKESQIMHPFMIFIIFKDIMGYPNLGMHEKTLWEIPIFYKDVKFVLAHKKFGFSICANEKIENYDALGKEAIRLIHKAIPFAETLINPIIHQKVNEGKVTIESKYSKMRNRYLFFQEKALNGCDSDKVKFSELNIKSGIKNFRDGEAYEEHFELMSRYASARTYYLLAMIDAYFSLLEHISVLLLPFIKEVKISEVKLDNFLGLTWKTKLRTILQYKSNKEALRYLEILDEIKEQIRNPASHGDYFKNGSSFHVHMSGIGAIPFTLTKSKQNFKFSDDSKKFITVENIVKHFDDFDKYLETSNTKYGMMYVKRNLPVAFDTKSVTKYRRRCRTEKSTEKYIDDTVKELENLMNMAW